MYKSKLAKAIVFILLTVGVLQTGIMAYFAVANQIAGRYAAEISDIGGANAVAADNTVQEVQIPKEVIDIGMINLKKEVEDKITSLDAVNATRNIRNYKTLLVALDVPESFQVRIEELYEAGHKVPDVLTAYEYLYQNYGNMDELGGLIEQRESGKAWNSIFLEYKKTKPEFEPSNFDGGQLEEILKTPGITPDDIIIADRIAQQTGSKLDELIALRGRGMAWKAINESLGIVNTSGELPRTAVTRAQVSSYMKSMGLSEERIIEALVLAQKLDRDGKTVVEKIKAGAVEEDIIAESLEEKYR